MEVIIMRGIKLWGEDDIEDPPSKHLLTEQIQPFSFYGVEVAGLTMLPVIFNVVALAVSCLEPF